MLFRQLDRALRIGSSPAVVAALLIAAGSLLPGGCAPLQRRQAPPVILISIDTCRADHLGCYGASRPATPHLDRFASEALCFTQAITTVPLTLPAHSSILTGLSPLQHGVRDNLDHRLEDTHPAVAEILGAAGYQTAAIVGAFVLDSRFGLARGFQHYDDRLDGGLGDPGQINERPGGEVTRLALEWLDEAPRGPFFLFVHYFDPHSPYAPPEPFAALYRDDPYSGEIAHVDAQIGRLFARLRELDLYDRSLIIVLSDHGEGLGEHGETGHGYFIYQSTMRVPLLVKPPGPPAPRRVDEPASLIDVAPTILGRAGLDPPPEMEGEDLLRLAGAAGGGPGARTRDLYCESLTPTKIGCSPLLGLVRGSTKYILTTDPELYDLARDPGEEDDLAGRKHRLAGEMEETLESLLAEAAEFGGGEDGPGAASDEERERLRSLGYIGGRAVSTDLAVDGDRPDPKEQIGLHEDLERLVGLMQASRLGEARALSEALLAVHGELPDLWILHGDIAHAQGRLEEAADDYRRFLAAVHAEAGPAEESSGGGVELLLGPDHARGHYNLANTLAALGRTGEALEHYRRAIDARPEHIEARYNLALTLAEAGRVGEAIDGLRELLALAPDFGPAHLDLAEALRAAGRGREAEAQLIHAIEVLPEFAPARLRLGDLHAAAGNLPGARVEYAHAWRLAPESPEALLKLAQVTMQMGDGEEARELIDTARRTFPALASPPDPSGTAAPQAPAKGAGDRRNSG